MLTINRPIDQTAVISPRHQIHGGGRRRLIYEDAETANLRSPRSSSKHEAPSTPVKQDTATLATKRGRMSLLETSNVRAQRSGHALRRSLSEGLATCAKEKSGTSWTTERGSPLKGWGARGSSKSHVVGDHRPRTGLRVLPTAPLAASSATGSSQWSRGEPRHPPASG